MPTASVSLNTSNLINSEIELCQTKVCGDRVKCFDCGNEISDWICEALQRSDLRLLRQDANHIRTNRKGVHSQLSLANQAQYLLINSSSIDLLAHSIPNYEINNQSIANLLARFRANFVIKCDKEFIEQSCSEIKIGDNIFKCTGPCTRCQMICIDQTTGEKTIEPLRTLSTLTESKIKFGVYLSHIYIPSSSNIIINTDVTLK